MNTTRMALIGIVAALVLSSGQARADAACEKRIKDTGMYHTVHDPKVICDRNPSREAQDCMVEVLSKSKGKLRNSDLFEVYAFCSTDPRPVMRQCLLRGLDRPWNHKDYRGAGPVGQSCLKAKYRNNKTSQNR